MHTHKVTWFLLQYVNLFGFCYLIYIWYSKIINNIIDKIFWFMLFKIISWKESPAWGWHIHIFIFRISIDNQQGPTIKKKESPIGNKNYEKEIKAIQTWKWILVLDLVSTSGVIRRAIRIFCNKERIFCHMLNNGNIWNMVFLDSLICQWEGS